MTFWANLIPGLFFAVAAVSGWNFSLSQAPAKDIVGKWEDVKAPAPPELKPVRIEPASTALLMLDFMNQNCGKRPNCIASIPAVKKLLVASRSNNVPVVYSFIANTTAADVVKEVSPAEGEPAVTSGPDKFLRTDLEKILRDKGIKTVIAVGTAANGAVLYTASGAALRGMNVIVPVDGMSSVDAYADLTAAWTLVNAPGVGPKTILTRIDMIEF